MPPLFADVVFPDRISRPFTYRIPPPLLGQLKVGQWVVAPLGLRTLAGFILSLSEQLPKPWHSSPAYKMNIRELQDVLTTSSAFALDPMLVDLAQWMSEYYLAPLGLCLQLIQPPRLPDKVSSRITITEEGLAAATILRASTNRMRLLTALAKRPKGLTRSTLGNLVSNLDPVLAQLKRQGFVHETYSITPYKNTSPPHQSSNPPFETQIPTTAIERGAQTQLFQSSLGHSPSPEDPTSALSFEPRPTWWEAFQHGLGLSQFQEFLVSNPWARNLNLLGHSIEETIRQGKSALLISPDMYRASHIANFFGRTWGNQVGVFHSDLPEATKQANWEGMSRGQLKIVVGTRLALFVPMPSLGLISLEDEEDSSYKEEQCPYYHARDVARQRATLSGASLLVQSRYPSLETYSHFLPSDPMSEISPRHEQCRPPDVQVVDLRHSPYGTILSHEMGRAVESALQAGGGIVFYVNRKGFSSSLLCRDCGIGLECPRCHVSLNMFKPPPRLVCAYCGYAEAVPDSCPTCSSLCLEPAGIGTERLEEELKQSFPTATIARLDRNAIRTRQTDTSIREKFRRGEISILVGTQMLFHGEPLHSVRLLGIPYAESGLHLPDFRAAEHLYQHLQQAIDLVRSEPEHGKVVLQTRLPTHHAIDAIVQQNPQLFYEPELEMRKALGYPPSSQVIQLSVSGTNQNLVQDVASQWAKGLALQFTKISSTSPSLLGPEHMILGPIPLQRHKSGKRHRYQILVKAQASMLNRRMVKDAMDVLKSDHATKGIQFRVNVDPVDML